MARDQRRRTVRSEDRNRQSSPVQLREARRFYSASGNDGATRTARALTQAFGAGTELFEQIVDKRNVEGRQQAAFESAAGGSRGDNATKGYNEMWDEIEAANDLHLFSKELPEVLRGADWENLTEEEAQGVIDGYFQKELAGINPESVYGAKVAEGILKQNLQLIETHRNFQLERIRQEQRVMIHNEARRMYETDGVMPYDQIADRTGKAFDGPEKMTAYWELLGTLAVEYKDENIILDMPERFPSGDPTGMTDPKFAEIKQGYINKAIAAREADERAAAAAAKAQREELRKDGVREMIEAVIRDEDPTQIGYELLDADVIEGSDYTSAISAYRSMRDDRSKQGADYTKVALHAAQISNNPSQIDEKFLLTEFGAGTYGPPDSPEAQATFRGLLDDRAQAMDRQARLAADPKKKVWVNRFKGAFPVPTDKITGLPVPGAITELRAEYVAAMELAVLQAGPEQYAEVFNQLSTQYKDAYRLVEAQESATLPKSTFSQLAQGNLSAEEAAAHSRRYGWTADHYIQARKDKEIIAEEGTPAGDAYRALLQELAK